MMIQLAVATTPILPRQGTLLGSGRVKLMTIVDRELRALEGAEIGVLSPLSQLIDPGAIVTITRDGPKSLVVALA